tara:strand:- start:582 stop:995 length:414 start_codon:yes stop_codon:yes gene_type:complete
MLKRLLVRYEWLILIGVFTSILSLCNVVGWSNINSDLFWCGAGVALVGEGIIELYYESKNDVFLLGDESDYNLHTLTERMNSDPLKGVVTLSHGDKGVTMSFNTFKGHILQQDNKEKPPTTYKVGSDGRLKKEEVRE